MSNGIDWFRWHHGSVTDPKFPLVAKKAGASLPDVLAVWAYLLETASAAQVRGHFGNVDTEALDLMFGFDDGKTEQIISALQSRNLIVEGNFIEAWDRRQVKREREDNTAAERKREQRAREAQAGVTEEVTPCHAMSHQVTPREEKSREEEKREEPKAKAPRSPSAAFDAKAELLLRGVDEQTASDWLALRKSKRAVVTATVLKTIIEQADKAGMALGRALETCCKRGWTGFEAEWVLKDQRQSPPDKFNLQNVDRSGDQALAEASRRKHGIVIDPNEEYQF